VFHLGALLSFCYQFFYVLLSKFCCLSKLNDDDDDDIAKVKVELRVLFSTVASFLVASVY